MYRKLLIFAMALLRYYCIDATCSETVLQEIDLRHPNNTYNSNQFIDDYYLTEGWYHTDNAFKLVDTVQTYGTCGTINPVYINGSHPSLDTLTEEEILLETCVRTYLDECEAGPSVAIKYCQGKLEYMLQPTPYAVSGYCFESIDSQFYSLEVNLDNVTVRPEVRHACTTNYCFPSLFFVCDFTQLQDDGYEYIVVWYHDGTYFMTMGPSSDVSDLDLSEDVLVNNSKGLGTIFQCGVGATLNGTRSQMNYSQSFFAGIVMNDVTVNLRKSEEYTLSFRVTIPIGCPHPYDTTYPYNPNYSLGMFDRTLSCKRGGILTIDNQRKCGRDIPCQRQGEDSWNPDEVYTITIAAKTVNTNDPTTYTLSFRMQERENGHQILVGYEPNSVTVIVPREEEVYEHKKSHAHVDPHYLTIDGLNFDDHTLGSFTFYENSKYGIVVQERTETCNNGIATCVCSVAIRAGGDLFLADRCNGARFYGFLQCRDNGILQIEEISTWNLRVHTPIGTYVKIDHVWYNFLNVDVYMAPKDFNQTKGLCGTYDGDITNDLTMRNGTVDVLSYNPTEFAESWRIADDDANNLFNPQYEGGLWSNDNEIFCFCDHDESSQSNEATCDGTMYTEHGNCQDNTSSSTTQKYCDKVQGNNGKRTPHVVKEELTRRRSLSFPEKHTREKRQMTNITADDAFNVCNTSIWASHVTNFTGTVFLSADDVNNKVQQCAFDVETIQDYVFVNIHIQALNGIVKHQLEQDPVYAANNANTVTYFLQNSCENNCSGNGVCDTNGTCVCNSIYSGSDCSINVTAAPVIDYVTNYGLCDVNYQSDCQCYDVVTENILDGFKCKSQEFVVGVDGTLYPTTEETYNGSYLNVYEGECCFPNSRQELSSVNGGFYTRYSLTISNDGTNYGEPVSIYVYDSTCQQNVTNTTGHISFQLKSDYCFIDGVCVAENQTRINSACYTCVPSDEQYNWTYVSGCIETTPSSTTTTTIGSHTVNNESDDDDDKKTNIILATVLSVVAVICVITVVVLVKKLHSRNKTGTNATTSNPTSPGATSTPEGRSLTTSRPTSPGATSTPEGRGLNPSRPTSSGAISLHERKGPTPSRPTSP